MTLNEKAAYLKGLADGLGMLEDAREGKLWAALTSLLSDMTAELDELRGSVDELYYDEEEDEEAEPEEEEETPAPASCGCPNCSGACGNLSFLDEDYMDLNEADEEIDGVIYDVACPKCGEEITIDEAILKTGSMLCPRCGETLEFDLDEE